MRIFVFICSAMIIFLNGRGDSAYRQELVGYSLAQPVAWDSETGAPVYGLYAMRSDLDGLWYEPIYEWRQGDEASYAEPTFRQVEDGVCEVWPYEWLDSTFEPIYEDCAFRSELDGHYYKRSYAWVEEGDPLADEPSFVHALRGYRMAVPLYTCPQTGTNVYGTAAFHGELDDVLYEPDCEWIRAYAGWEKGTNAFEQVVVGYRIAEVVGYTNGVDVLGNDVECPVYRRTALPSEKDGKMYEPVCEWRVREKVHAEPLPIAFVSPEGYVLDSTLATNVLCVMTNRTFKVLAAVGALDVRYSWEVYEWWTESDSEYYYDEPKKWYELVVSTNGNNVTSLDLPIVSQRVGGGSYLVSCTVTSGEAEEVVRWNVHLPQTYYVSATSLTEAPNGKTWASAFRSIGDAVTAAAANDIVRVGPGTYGSVRVEKALVIESVQGASVTIIDPTMVAGGGSDSCFCAGRASSAYYLGESSELRGRDVVLRGFSLQHGGNMSTYSGTCGGGVCGGIVEDCIIRDNVGIAGGGAADAKLVRCVIVGNRACSASAASRCELNHCTVVGNRCVEETTGYNAGSGDAGVAIGGSSVVCNSIVRWNYDKDGVESNYYAGGTYLEYSGSAYSGTMVVTSNVIMSASCSVPLAAGSDNIACDPLFVDWAGGDFRLRSGSPCLNLDMGAIAYDESFTFIAAASGAPTLHWAKGVVSDWAAATSELVCPTTTNGVSPCVDAVGFGSGWLSFEWRQDSSAGRDRLGLSIDGVGERAIVGDVDWKNVTIYVSGGGSHRFSWTATKAKSGKAKTDCAYLRNVRWVREVEGVSIGVALGQPGLAWSSDGWRVGQDPDEAGGYYLVAEELPDDATASVSAVITGPVKLSFDWRVSSEEYYDYLDFLVDGAVVQWITGETGREHVELMLTNGVHTVSWEYGKDEAMCSGFDAGWLRDIVLATETSTAEVSVPYAWLERFPSVVEACNHDYDAAARAQTFKVGASAACPSYVWQDYVAGTNPTNRNDVLKATVSVLDGTPVVKWKPELEESEVAKRIYTIYGKKLLSDADWAVVPIGFETNYNFFKVSVRMR